jgi:hypothetical protein
MTHADLMALLMPCLASCAPVTLTLHHDHAIITQCPPVVLRRIMEQHAQDTYHVSVVAGGLRVDLVDVKKK